MFKILVHSSIVSMNCFSYLYQIILSPLQCARQRSVGKHIGAAFIDCEASNMSFSTLNFMQAYFWQFIYRQSFQIDHVEEYLQSNKGCQGYLMFAGYVEHSRARSAWRSCW